MVIGSRKAVGETRLVAAGSGMAGAGVDWISGKNPGLLCVSIFSISNVFQKNLLNAFNGVGRRRTVCAGEEEWEDEEFLFELPGFPEDLWFRLILLVGVLNLYCSSIDDH